MLACFGAISNFVTAYPAPPYAKPQSGQSLGRQVFLLTPLPGGKVSTKTNFSELQIFPSSISNSHFCLSVKLKDPQSKHFL